MSTEAVTGSKPPAENPDDVLFHTNYGVRAIELNRPAKLNALSGYMAGRILERLRVCTYFYLSLLLRPSFIQDPD